jgi:putative flippase GtrA
MTVAPARSTAGSILGFASVGVIGFATDAGLLAVGLAAGLPPAGARAISTTTALQTTFVLNGLFVFRTLNWKTLPRSWLGYMVSNAFGAACNWLVFVVLTSSRIAFLSERIPAFVAAAAIAMVFNYLGARGLAFRQARA